jgi:hypothetical protein
LLSVDDRLKKVRFRKYRYGLGLLLRGRLARTLRLKGAAKRVPLTITAIDNLHVE